MKFQEVAFASSAVLCVISPMAASAQNAAVVASPVSAPVLSAPPPAAPPTVRAGTPVIVVVNENISTQTHKVGDRFQVIVSNDVSDQGAVIVPQGTIGYGEVTFATKNGGFGKAGILGIALRTLELDGKSVALDGRYREEGRSGEGAAAATMFAAGIFAGLVKGKSSTIPKGRELKARIGEDIVFAPPPEPGSDAGQPPAVPAI